jgi:8-oxo-dGTP pyrophosphatase MutT (NUDIX family)
MKVWCKSLELSPGHSPTATQVGAICLDPGSGKVLLVTSRGTGRWVIPKGWPMEGRTLGGAAAQEAWEEAGVRGQISADELGRYTYEKRQDARSAVHIEVRVFALEVESQSDDFPERRERKRRWLRPSEAAQLVAEPELKNILEGLEDPEPGPCPAKT